MLERIFLSKDMVSNVCAEFLKIIEKYDINELQYVLLTTKIFASAITELAIHNNWDENKISDCLDSLKKDIISNVNKSKNKETIH